MSHLSVGAKAYAEMNALRAEHGKLCAADVISVIDKHHNAVLVPIMAKIAALEASKSRKLGSGGSSSADLYREPENWQIRAAKLYPGTEVAKALWFDLSTDVRAKILRGF